MTVTAPRNRDRYRRSSATYHSYVNATVQMLKAAPLNLGMGGSCFIERAIADFIAARDDWDFASFELGINLVNPTRDNAHFAEKVDYLLETVAARYPRQVTLIEGTDIVPDFRGFQVDLLHPEPFAYARMGIRLAEASPSILAKLR